MGRLCLICVQIETAYDALLMKSMKARLSGELKPARDVRFADVQKYRPAQPRVRSANRDPR